MRSTNEISTVATTAGYKLTLKYGLSLIPINLMRVEGDKLEDKSW